MVPISERGVDAAQRRVPAHGEGDLIIGKNGASCAATLVERMSGSTALLTLPSKLAETTADAVIESLHDLPQMMRASLAWDRGSEMAQHAKVSRATTMPVYFADPHSPCRRPSNENTNRLYRGHLPQRQRDPGPPALPHHHQRRAEQPPPPPAGTTPPPRRSHAYWLGNHMLLPRLRRSAPPAAQLQRTIFPN